MFKLPAYPTLKGGIWAATSTNSRILYVQGLASYSHIEGFCVVFVDQGCRCGQYPVVCGHSASFTPAMLALCSTFYVYTLLICTVAMSLAAHMMQVLQRNARAAAHRNCHIVCAQQSGIHNLPEKLQ